MSDVEAEVVAASGAAPGEAHAEGIVFFFQSTANGQRKGKPKQNKKNQILQKARKEVRLKAAWKVMPLSSHCLCNLCESPCLGIRTLGAESVFLPPAGRLLALSALGLCPCV